MKSLKDEAKQVLIAMLAVMTVAGGNANMFASADEIGVPVIENRPIVIFDDRSGLLDYMKPSPDEDPAKTAMSGTDFKWFNCDPAVVTISDDDCKGSEHDMEHIKGVYINYNGKDYEATYSYNDTFDTMFINIMGIMPDYIQDHQVTDESYVTVQDDGSVYFSYWNINQIDYKAIFEALKNEVCTFRIVYEDGTESKSDLRFTVNDINTHLDMFLTSQAVVLKLADCKSITNEDLEALENAIVYASESENNSNKYYVNIDSKQDVVIPIKGMAKDALLTQTRINDSVIYNTSASVDFSNNAEGDVVTESELGRVFTFKLPDGSDNYAVPSQMYPVYLGLVDYGVRTVMLDGEKVDVPTLGYMNDKGIYLGNTTYFNTTFMPQESYSDDLMVDMVEKGYAPKYSTIGLPDSNDVHGEPSDEYANSDRFRIEFKYNDTLTAKEFTTLRWALTDDIRDIPSSTQVDKHYLRLNSRVSGYSNSVVEVYHVEDNGDQTMHLGEVETLSGLNGINNDGTFRLIKSIEFSANDYDTINAIIKVFNDLPSYNPGVAVSCVSIDYEHSYMPDLEHVTASDVSVKDLLQLEEISDIKYEHLNMYSNDLKFGGRRGSQSDSVGDNTKELALNAYEDGQVRFSLDKLKNFEKGTLYSVVNQVQIPTLNYIGVSSGHWEGDTNHSHWVYDNNVFYHGGDFLQAYVKYEDSIRYAEYKWGDIVLASCPDAITKPQYTPKTCVLEWDKPIDEGFGVEDGKTKKDDYIYIRTYTINVKDENGKVIYTTTIGNNGDEHQSVELPEGTIEYNKKYQVEILATNPLGSSQATLDLEFIDIQTPDEPQPEPQPEKPTPVPTPDEPTSDSDKPKDSDTPKDSDKPKDSDTPKDSDKPKSSDTPKSTTNTPASGTTTATTTTQEGKPSLVQTGDVRDVGIFAGLMLSSMGAYIALRKKKESDEN